MMPLCKAIAKQLLGARYEGAVRALAAAGVLYLAVRAAGWQVTVAPAVLCLNTAWYTAGVLLQQLQGCRLQDTVAALLAMPCRQRLAPVYTLTVVGCTLLTRTLPGQAARFGRGVLPVSVRRQHAGGGAVSGRLAAGRRAARRGGPGAGVCAAKRDPVGGAGMAAPPPRLEDRERALAPSPQVPGPAGHAAVGRGGQRLAAAVRPAGGGAGGAVRGPALAHRAAEKLSRPLPPLVPKKDQAPRLSGMSGQPGRFALAVPAAGTNSKATKRSREQTIQKERRDTVSTLFFLVRKMGLEPTRHGHTHLKRACLPIPALPQMPPGPRPTLQRVF